MAERNLIEKVAYSYSRTIMEGGDILIPLAKKWIKECDDWAQTGSRIEKAAKLPISLFWRSYLNLGVITSEHVILPLNKWLLSRVEEKNS